MTAQLWNRDCDSSKTDGCAACSTLHCNLNSHRIVAAPSTSSPCAPSTAGRQSDHDQKQDGGSPYDHWPNS